MIITAVESTLLRTVGYDAGRELLEVDFHNGARYRYLRVPAEVYTGLLEASSKGQYFNRVIRPKFAYVRLKAAVSG